MDNRYSHLGDRIIVESVKGGPGRYRNSEHGTNPQAQHLAELRVMREERPHRVVRLKLPRLETIKVKLPMWALIGTPSA